MNLAAYNKSCFKISQLVISRYSTSFWWGTRMFPPKVRCAIAAIYGFVRLADEIVDTFHEFDKAAILASLRTDLELALARGISINPLLQAFQLTVREYGIDRAYIEAFLRSMEMDLTLKNFSRAQYEEYVYGSAEVIGLMCLKVFCHQQPDRFESLAPLARKLGSAFQKVNFLRDIRNDLEVRGRVYFPDLVSRSQITSAAKQKMESEIAAEFIAALQGIRQLPRLAKFPVYATYLYYHALFDRLKACDISVLLSRRVRINNFHKSTLLVRAWMAVQTARV